MSNLDRYRHLFPAADLEQLLQVLQAPPAPSFRVNTLKSNIGEALEAWPAPYAWQVEPIPFCLEGYRLIDYTVPLGDTLEYRMGYYYIQEAASMLPPEVFTPDSNPHLLTLDMAAAPGGKTTHLICKTGDRGLTIANDTATKRIPALIANLRVWGALSTVVTNFPGERFGGWYPETFDRILLDAPCSGESLREVGGSRGRPVSAHEREGLHRRQVNLLLSAFKALKPGGEIVYATCTAAPEENEAVLDALLGIYPNAAEIAPVKLACEPPAAALRSFDGSHFNPQVQNALRLWPHIFDTSAFFVALIRKVASISVSSQSPPAQHLEERGFNAISASQQRAIGSSLLEYGFDLADTLERYALAMLAQGQLVYALPDLYLSHFAPLPFKSAGMLVGKWYGDQFIPSHELVSRFDPKFTGGRFTLSEDQAHRWLQGWDLHDAPVSTHQAGVCLLLQDERGRFLGRGKLSGDRIRNMLPSKWV